MNKVIKDETDYKQALSELERLMDQNPARGTAEADRLELLTLLIQDWESRSYSFTPADPVEAIRFRMEQQNLRARDLIPYLGSRSKVSEVLARKRPLTLAMVRALHSGLGIPARSLISEQSQDEALDWDRFPLKQMISWGWVSVPEGGAPTPEETLRPFFAKVGSVERALVLCRTSSHTRSARSMDEYALVAWSSRVLAKAMESPATAQFKRDKVDADFMHEVVRLSTSDRGPAMVGKVLGRRGICFVVERHLPGTYLDGAALIVEQPGPVVALTLRYDRLDNFWFTLIHELAHIALHFSSESDAFYDDLDLETENDAREREADEMGGEVLVPQEAWRKSPASRLRSPEAAEHLARQLGIHPAIIAGRMRHEFKAYRLLNHLVGHGKARELFPEVQWG